MIVNIAYGSHWFSMLEPIRQSHRLIQQTFMENWVNLAVRRFINGFLKLRKRVLDVVVYKHRPILGHPHPPLNQHQSLQSVIFSSTAGLPLWSREESCANVATVLLDSSLKISRIDVSLFQRAMMEQVRISGRDSMKVKLCFQHRL